MKNKALLALATYALAGGFIVATQAKAEGPNNLEMSRDELSHMTELSGSALPNSGLAVVPARPKSEALEHNLMRSNDDRALVSGPATPVILPGSLVATHVQEQLPLSGQATGGGFAAIKAASAVQGRTTDLMPVGTMFPAISAPRN